MEEIKSEIIKAVATALIGIVIGFITQKIAGLKKFEEINKELSVSKIYISKADSLIKFQESEIESYDVVLDSIGKVNQELVTSIKGSVVTIEKLIKNKTISEQDKKEALQWLDQ